MIRRPFVPFLFVLSLFLVQGCGGGTTTDGDASGSGVVAECSNPNFLTQTTCEEAGHTWKTPEQDETDAADGSESDALTEADGDEATDTDGLSVFPSDLPVITEIDEDVDLSDWFPDAVGPEPDVTEPPDVTSESDAVAMTDTVAMSDTVELSDDAVGADAAEDAGNNVPDTFLSDCENLGVAPSWQGSFEGAIEYHIPEALEELFYPPDGILIVGGELAFDIECVDSKLIVSGDMDGAANVAGEGDFPFQVTLAGYFDPNTGQLTANMVEGMVILYELAEIQFSGEFSGTLVDEVFDGAWTAQYDGTNFPLPPGDEPEANGLGTWTAAASDTE